MRAPAAKHGALADDAARQAGDAGAERSASAPRSSSRRPGASPLARQVALEERLADDERRRRVDVGAGGARGACAIGSTFAGGEGAAGPTPARSNAVQRRAGEPDARDYRIKLKHKLSRTVVASRNPSSVPRVATATCSIFSNSVLATIARERLSWVWL
jgi:hypothetical protein